MKKLRIPGMLDSAKLLFHPKTKPPQYVCMEADRLKAIAQLTSSLEHSEAATKILVSASDAPARVTTVLKRYYANGAGRRRGSYVLPLQKWLQKLQAMAPKQP